MKKERICYNSWVEANKREYNRAIDMLRIVSILAVILIHSTTKVFEATGNNLSATPWSLFLNQAARFAVPLFLMISGFSLELSYPRSPNYWAYLKKRVQKIFVPYIVWSLIYYFGVYNHRPIGGFPAALLDGSASNQLYFIPTVLIFYLIFPLLHRYYDWLSNKWILLGLGGIQIGLLYIDYFVQPLHLYYSLAIVCLNFFVFIVGMVAARTKDLTLKLKKWRYVSLTLTVLLAFYLFWEGGSRFAATGNYLAFYSQWRPSVLLYTLSVATLLYYLFDKIPLRPWLIKRLAGLSFFVFFIHMIILEQAWKLFGKTTGGLERDILVFGLTATLSFGIGWIIHHIPRAARLTS